MQTHPRKRIEWIVEESVVARIVRAIEDQGATGYSVIRNVSGKGHHGERRGAGISGVFENAMIVVITTEETARKLLAETQSLMRDRVGIVYLSDVEVLRAEHF
jgi:PII-like signaling protein